MRAQYPEIDDEWSQGFEECENIIVIPLEDVPPQGEFPDTLMAPNTSLFG